jgi:hypothetical protein
LILSGIIKVAFSLLHHNNLLANSSNNTIINNMMNFIRLVISFHFLDDFHKKELPLTYASLT